MAENLHHGKVVSDQGFGMLRQMIAYKTNLVKVPAKDTSKTCFDCGYVNPNACGAPSSAVKQESPNSLLETT